MSQVVKNIFLGTSVFLVLSAGTAGATIVTNGSFEDGTGIGSVFSTPFDDLGTPDNSSWDIYTGTSVTGWTSETNGIEIQTSGTLPFIDAYDGENYVELDTTANSGMQQVVQLSVGRYELTFAFAPRINAPCSPIPCVSTNGVTYGIGNSAGDLFSLLADGPSSAVPWGQWTVFTHVFTVTTAGDYTLFFDATGRPESLGGLIDGVSIAAVPVPAGGLLLLGALGGLAALRRRKLA
jgi:hypothetical protein